MTKRNGTWYLFFEIMNCFSEQGDIAYAESRDGNSWTYRGVVLDEPFHLSYPHIFQHEGRMYMIPESRQGGGIRLYEATDFPFAWKFVKLLVPGDFADPSIFQHEGRWWIFAVQGAYSLAILYADRLDGPWSFHTASPLYVDDKSRSRPAGRVIHDGDRIIRFAQDNRKRYGHQVRAFIIDRLTPTTFEERELEPIPFLAPTGKGWNGVGMHHIDAHQLEDGSWMAVVDGAGEVEIRPSR